MIGVTIPSRRAHSCALNVVGTPSATMFIEATIAKAAAIKIIPMIGSLGCPYTCSFCIDAAVDYQPLDRDQIRDDLRFLLDRRCYGHWHPSPSGFYSFSSHTLTR